MYFFRHFSISELENKIKTTLNFHKNLSNHEHENDRFVSTLLLASIVSLQI